MAETKKDWWVERIQKRMRDLFPGALDWEGYAEDGVLRFTVYRAVTPEELPDFVAAALQVAREEDGGNLEILYNDGVQANRMDDWPHYPEGYGGGEDEKGEEAPLVYPVFSGLDFLGVEAKYPEKRRETLDVWARFGVCFINLEDNNGV